ncbi:GNAT family N-acetyltransferase [Empedobacter brevis]|uniref:GNAT family N-acetyltransferase n=1 Tax=Empedobacter brevis TaxID=247 RepID=UPI0039AF6182
MKTIFTVIGMYFISLVVLLFIFYGLILSGVIDLGVQMKPVSLDDSISFSEKLKTYEVENKDFTEAFYTYFVNNNVQLIMHIIIYILIGMFYYNSLKRKWTLQMLEGEIDKRKDEILQHIEVNQKINPIKLDVYPHFHTVNEKNIHLVQPLAREIWNECYKDLLSQDQIDYMIDMMYNNDKVNEGIAAGDVWEVLKIDNVPSGYLHYKLDENNTVFLSKIYLKESNQTKGIGQLMMNRVLDYAREKGAKAVHLTVNKHNAKAIRFYEKNGFKRMESKTFDIGNGYIMDDYIYQKNLN